MASTIYDITKVEFASEQLGSSNYKLYKNIANCKNILPRNFHKETVQVKNCSLSEEASIAVAIGE